MEVISVKPRSYCKGVVLAIRKARQVKAENPETKVTLLGHLVHNELVTEALAKEGIATVSDKTEDRMHLLDQVDEGIVIFSAHGVSDAVRAKAETLGLTAVDATCPEVLYTQNLVKDKLAEGKFVFYVGKAGHPEAMALTDGLADVLLIHSLDSIPEPNFTTKEIFVTNQTTLSQTDLQSVFDAIRSRFPNAIFADELCPATRLRQEAVRKNADVDVLLVVGDPSSNNTQMLAKIGKEVGIPKVLRIKSIEELDVSELAESDRVGVTAGASTPPYLIEQVEDYLRSFDFANPEPLPKVDSSKILN